VANVDGVNTGVVAVVVSDDDVEVGELFVLHQVSDGSDFVSKVTV
jgi:hypothetical protein